MFRSRNRSLSPSGHVWQVYRDHVSWGRAFHKVEIPESGHLSPEIPPGYALSRKVLLGCEAQSIARSTRRAKQANPKNSSMQPDDGSPTSRPGKASPRAIDDLFTTFEVKP